MKGKTRIKTVLILTLSLTIAFYLTANFALILSVPDNSHLSMAYPLYTPGPTQTPRSPHGQSINFLPALYKSEPCTVDICGYYIVTTNGLSDLGVSLGDYYANHSSLAYAAVLLDFGNAVYRNGTYGTTLYDYTTFIITDSIKGVVQDFITGFYSRVSGTSVVLDVIVSLNDSRALDQDKNISIQRFYKHGQKWSNMITDLNTWIVGQHHSNHVYASAGIDFETQFWRYPAEGRNWVDGYSSSSQYVGYNFGNAAGCPLDYPAIEPATQVPTPYPRGCPAANDQGTPPPTEVVWNQEDIYYITHGLFSAIPEICNTNGLNEEQWYRIGLYEYLAHHGDNMSFYGSLTQYTACLQRQGQQPGTPVSDCSGANNSWDEGYNRLYNRLRADPYNRIDPQMHYKLDMKWYPNP